MLYNLLYPLHETFSAFNVFRYITFRSIYAALTALAVVLVLGPVVIEYLKRRRIGEKIRSDGPQTHMVKSGTPTMGGLIIIAAV
ncbi:MAG: phospho-N-acetylmuramoyl-pentapeptide-transferase, partial [Nitrospinae bacterium]|nr:phospho-N-acetylmuramoyl-pentapeptide-transferase [Nitrospinota bacterium]